MARSKLNYDEGDIRNSFGVRRRFKGKMGILVGHGKQKKLVPRSHHIDHKLAKISYECGQNECYQTVVLPGKFKVQMPHGRIKFVDQ